MAQAVLKGIAEGMSGAFAVVAAKENQWCFNCEELGHFMIDCPPKPGLTNNRTDHQWLHAYSNVLWRLGNSQQNMGWPRMMTPNAQPSQFSCPIGTSRVGKKDQFPHRPKIPSHKIPPEIKETYFTLRYRYLLPIQLEERDHDYRIPMGKHASTNGPFDVLIIGDPIHKVSEIFVYPEVQILE